MARFIVIEIFEYLLTIINKIKIQLCSNLQPSSQPLRALPCPLKSLLSKMKVGKKSWPKTSGIAKLLEDNKLEVGLRGKLKLLKKKRLRLMP